MRTIETKKCVFRLQLLIIVGAIGIYVFGVIHYSRHFYPKTILCGANVSDKSVAEAEQVLDKAESRKAVLLSNGSPSEPLYGRDFGLQISLPRAVKLYVSDQNSAIWPFVWLKSHRIQEDLKISYDETKLAEQIHNLNMISGEGRQQPVDAYVKLDTSGKFDIVSEKPGTILDEAAVVSDVKAAIQGLDYDSISDTIDVTKDLVPAKVKSDSEDLKMKCDMLNRMFAGSLTIDLTGVSDTIPVNILTSWVQTDGDKVLFDDAGQVRWNDGVLSAFVNELATKYNTLGRPQSFKTADGNVISIGTDHDSWGFVLDKEATKQAIVNALQSDQHQVQAVWNTGYGVPTVRNEDGTNIGNTYAEVSIGTQHMWFYKDGQLVLESDVVTGKPRSTPDEHGDTTVTHTGIYYIWNKRAPATLHGSYGTSHVNYWMGITWDGIGFHDALWQSAFGGERYKTGHGSHGCVNLPYDVAQQLYDMIELGMPVVIHY